jgi:hypothetical protein
MLLQQNSKDSAATNAIKREAELIVLGKGWVMNTKFVAGVQSDI